MPRIAALYRDRLRWISVDEFQDVDEQQYRLLTLLAPPDGNLCVIGDPNQAIYGFRGADASCFDRFRQDYPGRQDRAARAQLPLERHHRHRRPRRSLRRGRREPVAEIVRDMHERIAIHAAPTERAEAEFVVKTIEHMIGGHSFFSIDSGRADAGVAEQPVVRRLRRALPHRRAVDGAMRGARPLRHSLSEALPCRRSRRSRPCARCCRNSATAATRRRWRMTCAPPPAAGGARRRRRGATMAMALQRLIALAERCGNDRARFADAAALTTDAEFCDARADRVSLLTLHAAKGLEFAGRVHRRARGRRAAAALERAATSAAMAEERRLFYVGMTRAKDRLILTRARQRFWRGRTQTLEPSPFLRDIENELVKHHADGGRRKPEDRQLKLL